MGSRKVDDACDSKYVSVHRTVLPEVGPVGRTVALAQNAQHAAGVRQSETDMFSDYALCKGQAN